jgi:hypothetical protein
MAESWRRSSIFLFVLFMLLGSGVWVGLALLGVAWSAWSCSPRALPATP